MEHQKRKARARFRAGLVRISARFVSVVAVIAALAVGANLTAAPAGAAVVHHSASSAVRMKEAIAFIRAHDHALAHASDQKIENLIKRMAKNASESNPAPAWYTRDKGIGADFLGVSKTGDTLWFNKADVVAWAVASTALVIGSLVYVGVELSVAVEFAERLLDDVWLAAIYHRCAWFTYNNPRSLGTYSC